MNIQITHLFVSFIYRFKLHVLNIPHFSRSWVLTIGIRAILVFMRNGLDWLKTYMKFFCLLDKNFSDSQPGNFYDKFYLFFMVDSIVKQNRLLPSFIYFLLFLPDHIRIFSTENEEDEDILWDVQYLMENVQVIKA